MSLSNDNRRQNDSSGIEYPLAVTRREYGAQHRVDHAWPTSSAAAGSATNRARTIATRTDFARRSPPLHRISHNSFDHEIQLAELDYLFGSKAAATAFAENYVGFPY